MTQRENEAIEAYKERNAMGNLQKIVAPEPKYEVFQEEVEFQD